MFKFFFGSRKADAVPETTRQTFDRLTTDLNSLLRDLPEKPKVTIDPNTGEVTFQLPEQLPDEALALPSPTPDHDTSTVGAPNEAEVAVKAKKTAEEVAEKAA